MDCGKYYFVHSSRNYNLQHIIPKNPKNIQSLAKQTIHNYFYTLTQTQKITIYNLWMSDVLLDKLEKRLLPATLLNI